MQLHSEPADGWKSIFELWRDNGERVPIEVVKRNWNRTAGHNLVVERIDIVDGVNGIA